MLSPLRVLADNPDLLKLAKEAVLAEFADDEVLATMTDEQIGQITRARVSGIKKVEDAFQYIASFATPKKSTPQENPAY